MAVAAALLAFVAAPAFVLGGGQDEDAAGSRTAPMRTNAGEVVGDATLDRPRRHPRRGPGLGRIGQHLRSQVDATYWLAVEDGEGERALRRLPTRGGAPWTVELHDDPTTVAAVSIVDNGGTVVHRPLRVRNLARGS